MDYVLDYPVLVLVGSLLLQWSGAVFGHSVSVRTATAHPPDQRKFGTIISATLTLLALLIGFSLNMAVNRYDQRKLYEEAESNAIGTEFRRVSLMSNPAPAHELLIQYTDLRIQFYRAHFKHRVRQISADTEALQEKLWSSVAPSVLSDRPPVAALVLSGMTDMINAEGETQAAWRNHVPVGAWLLLAFVATAASILLGYGEEHDNRSKLLILPLIVSAAFFLISDVDSPRNGLIRMRPTNLIALEQVMKGHGPG